MASRKRNVEGVVTGQKNFGELDKIVEVFTKEHGKIRLLAKGVRKINSRRLGYLETGLLISAVIYTSNSFDILTEVDLLDKGISDKLTWEIESTLYLCEIISKLLPENQQEPRIYQAFLKTRNFVKQGKFAKIVLFQDFLLNSLGYGENKKAQKLILNNDIKKAHFILRTQIEQITENKLTSFKIFR